MFEDKRVCAGCGRVIGWTDPFVMFSDDRMLCASCLSRAYLDVPPVAVQHEWPSSKVINRIKAHDQYDAFCNKPGTKVLLGGNLLINADEQSFAIGCNDVFEQMIGFQSGSYANVENIGIYDGVQTKSIKISDGNSGAAGGVIGGLIFGPLGALAGTLETRTGAEYEDFVLTEGIGFTLTYQFGAQENFNVLKACCNYDFLNFENQRAEYDEVKALTMQICQELYRVISETKLQGPSTAGNKASVVSSTQVSNININPNNIEPTLTRIELFLEDKSWDKARAYAEAALDYFPTDYRVYTALLCSDMQVSSLDDLQNVNVAFDNNDYYKKAIRFGNEDLRKTLEDYIGCINERNETARLNAIYEKGRSTMNSADDEKAYTDAAKLFKQVAGFKDADELTRECISKAEECRKDSVYTSAKHSMEVSHQYESAIKSFETIMDWKDSKELIAVCQKKIDEAKAAKEAERIKREREEEAKRLEEEKKKEILRQETERKEKAAKKRLRIIVPILIVSIICVVLVAVVIIPKQKLNNAMKLLESGDYETAYSVLEEIGRDDLVDENKYERAVEMIDSGDYDSAYDLLKDLNYKDSNELFNTIPLGIQLGKAEVGSTVLFGTYEQDNNLSNGEESIEWLILGKQQDEVLMISLYGLDCLLYNSEQVEYLRWSDCSIRKWLNDSFYNKAFNKDEQKMILTAQTDDEPVVKDKVFLVGFDEYQRLVDREEWICQATKYCIAQGAETDESGNCYWWERWEGNAGCAPIVQPDGFEIHEGNITFEGAAVRPVIWVKVPNDD